MLYIITGLCFLFVSVISLQNALKAYIKKDFLLFGLNIILSLVCLLIGIILIVYGFKLNKVFYQEQGSPVKPGTSPNPSNDSGSGHNGNGNHNSNPNESGLGGSSQTDQERKKYNEKKLNYLRSQEDLYMKVREKARSNLKGLPMINHNPKARQDPSVRANRKRNKAIKEASQYRLLIVRR